MTWPGVEPDSMESQTMTVDKPSPTKDCLWRDQVSSLLFKALEDMYLSGRHTDLQVLVQEKAFNCHRVVLAATSQYFDAMFSSGMRECYDGVVRLQGIQSSTFEEILSLLYSGCLTIDVDNAEDLLKAATMFQIKILHKKCEDFLVQHITTDNCIGAWKLAKSNECRDLEKKAWFAILESFAEVCRLDDFNYFDFEDMVAIVKSDDLHVNNEEIVCDAVFRWYQFDKTSRKDSAYKIFEHLRLPLLGSEYLLHEVEPMELAVDNPRCREIVKEAIAYQMLPSRRPDFNSPRAIFRRYANMEDVLVVIGGYNATGEKVIDVMGFSFSRKTWFSLASLPWKLGREFAACVFGNDIFVTGGSQKLDSVLLYRSENNEWTRCPNMPQGRRRHAMVAVGETLLVLGGYDDNQKEEQTRTLSDVSEYSINSRTWESIGALETPVRSMTAAVSKEKVFVFGGILADEKETDIVQCFDTRLRQSTRVNDLPYACKLSRSVVCGRRVFVVCTDGNVLELDEDVCKRVAKIRDFNRRRFGAVHYRGDILILGGECGSAVHRDVFTFNPNTEESITLVKKSVPPRVNFGGLKLVMHKKFLQNELKVEGD